MRASDRNWRPFLSSVTAVGASSISDDSTSEEVDPRNSGGFSELFSRPAYQDAAVPRYLEALETGIYDGLYNPSGRGSELSPLLPARLPLTAAGESPISS